MNFIRKILPLMTLMFTAGLFTLSGDEAMNKYLSLYNFNSRDNDPVYEWKDFTDQVMGGRSEISTAVMQESGRLFVRMEGDVSLENNGGFIQTRLQLASGLGTFNASAYDGIRLRVRADGPGYYIFFRTSNTVFPWLHYKADINAGSGWRTIDIPWSEISKGDYGSMGQFKPSKLKSIALVAYGREFRARIDLEEIGLYRN